MRKTKLLYKIITSCLAMLLLSACAEKTIQIESIVLSKNTVEIKIDETINLTATVIPLTATESYVWKSADESIVSIDCNGVITPVSVGETNVMAITSSGKSSVCRVIVSQQSAISKLNGEERKVFDYLTETMLESFYDSSSAQVRRAYYLSSVDNRSLDEELNLIVAITAKNQMGGISEELYGIFTISGKTMYMKCGSSPDLSQPIPENVMNCSKINAALEEYYKYNSTY